MKEEHKRSNPVDDNAVAKGLADKELGDALDAVEMFGVSQKVVLVHPTDLTILLLRNANTAKWELPGGAVDKGEELSVALTRELQEELGAVRCRDIDSITSTRVQYSVLKKQFPVVLLAYSGWYEGGDIVLSKEHTEYAWKLSSEIMEMEDSLIAIEVKNFVRLTERRLKEREYLNDVKRISADFENYRRRQEERMKELSAMSSERFALDIIPVIDNFRMAAQHVPEAEKENAWMTGITYIGKQLEEALVTNGISAFEVKEGDTFDPHLHEAVSREEGESAEEGKVAKMLQMGYKSGSRVIRPAKVVVR